MERRDVESVETEWEMFSDIVNDCTNDICGVRREGSQKRKWRSRGMPGVVQRRDREEDVGRVL